MKIFRIASNGIKLWLDDNRDPQDPQVQKLFGSTGDEIWVKTIEEAKSYISQKNVESISFDNDLGEGIEEGYVLAKWIEEEAYFGRMPKIQWRVHSQNNVRNKEIFQAMTNADKFWER